MNAYQNALRIKTDTRDSRLDLARALLQSGEGAVLLEGVLALRSVGGRVICEVLSRFRDADQSDEAFVEEIAAARALLEASTIRDAVLAREHEWIVVDDYGMGVAQLWPRDGTSAKPQAP